MNRIFESLASSRKLQIGLASLALASVGGVAFAVPSSAQGAVTCFRTTAANGEVGVETRIQAPPCPEGFTEAPSGSDGKAPAPTPAPTTVPPETKPVETTAAPETTVPPETKAPATEESTTETTEAPSGDVKEAPPAKPVPGDPNYTG